ncbi:MAG TPA: hypothetical protein VGN34_18365 [Ktedonobacteraceae bacterium]
MDLIQKERGPGERKITREHFSSPISTENEVGHRRGIFSDPFPLPPSQTERATLIALGFPENAGHSVGNKQGLTHFAALQPSAILICSSCRPLPCNRISRSPWEVVTPPT